MKLPACTEPVEAVLDAQLMTLARATHRSAH